MTVEHEKIISIATWDEYRSYKGLVKSIDFLISHYRRAPEKADDMNESDPKVLEAKRNIILTIYKTLNGPDGIKIPVEYSHNRRINHVFERLFSDDKKSMPTYLKKIAKDLFLSKISDYEEKTLTGANTGSIYNMIVAEQMARTKGLTRVERSLHETIDQKLEAASSPVIETLAKTFKNPIMGQYDAYVQRGYFR
jgi:hypothetical protein